MTGRSTEQLTREIVERFRTVHGDRFGYGDVRFYGLNVKVKIVCSEAGHGVFEQTPTNHLSGQGCPRCKGRAAWETRASNGPGNGKSFADRCPQWVHQWDHERNGALHPEIAYPKSKKIVWWHEPACGHSWEQRITDRGVAAQRCPICTGDILQAGVNDVLTCHPDLAREWHPTRNAPLWPANISISSGKKVWWKCAACGEEWETKINSRTKGSRTGCPRCASNRIWEKRGRPPFERSFAGAAEPHLLNQWSPRNPEGPEDVYFGNTSKAIRWVHPDCGHEWRQSVYNRVKAAPGCPVCDGRVVVAGINDLSTTNPDIAARWHPTLNGDVTPRVLRPYSNKKLWWACPTCKRPFQRTVTGMVSNGSIICSDCSAVARGRKKAAPAPGRSFEDEHPNLAREWHPTRNGALHPNQLRSGSNERVWWLCDYGHEWEGQLSQRTSVRRRSCPHCTPGSYGERAVVDLLKEHGVKYERQWTDSSLRDQAVLRFDFMLPEFRMLIEFDGEQHRRPTRFGAHTREDAIAAFEALQRRDEKKTAWARENGWSLVRIDSIPSISIVLKAMGVI